MIAVALMVVLAQQDPGLEALPLPLPQTPAPKAHAGWARAGGVVGFGLAVIPVALSVGAVVALWGGYRNAQDLMTVGAGLSAPLVALLPTFGARSALIDDDSARKPRVLRVIGWVLTIYGAVSLVGGVVVGKLFGLVARGSSFEQYATGDVGRVFGTVTTLLNGVMCTAGVMMISGASVMVADRAVPVVMPTVAVVPAYGGGVAAIAGLSGSL